MFLIISNSILHLKIGRDDKVPEIRKKPSPIKATEIRLQENNSVGKKALTNLQDNNIDEKGEINT